MLRQEENKTNYEFFIDFALFLLPANPFSKVFMKSLKSFLYTLAFAVKLR